ncbi:hypothetical protein [Microbacterium foliorum]|uniref:hypothetical protein n=1 Tax=Microbacterium foliorum TaxID=104336 RepID=UPI001D9B0BD9|nr:hypothetical protein [Microbacterium foliorum]CAH0232123.1 hypothetical protein SRABI03_02743 [Microbacterium foliorum]CAH0246246.1 hypothetical protein SRABI44_03039 [Microbacterium foliorum]
MPAIVWICVIVASWVAGTCAQLSSVLNVPSPSLGLGLYWLGILQLGSIPVTLLAALPLLILSGRFERRDTPLRTRVSVLVLVALVTLAISISAYVLLNGASAGPLDESNPFGGVARDAATLVAFHLTPLFVLLAVQAAAPRGMKEQDARARPATLRNTSRV